MECISKYLSLNEYLILERMMWKVSYKIISKDWLYWHTVLVKYMYHISKLLKEGEVQKQRQWYFQDGVQEVQRKKRKWSKASKQLIAKIKSEN